MKGILYFSSTGNSLYLAKRIRERIPAHILYLPRYAGDGSEFDEVILVTPVYSFGLPVHSYDILQRLCHDVPLTVVLTYGGTTGGAERLVAELARRGNKNLRGVYAIQMPENYTLTFTTPKIYEKLVLRLAEKRIDRVIDAILRAELHLPAEGRTREALYEKNKSNWHLIGHDFSATEDCMQCGKCIAICPAGNIALEDGKVRFGDRCVACLGCYHRCPQKAIVYKHRRKKDRYINPKIQEAEIGKNF